MSSEVSGFNFAKLHPELAGASGKSEICLMPLKAPYCYLWLKVSRFKENMFKENLLKISVFQIPSIQITLSLLHSELYAHFYSGYAQF